ncbi:xylulokinase [Christensenellaceae bacterium OttesenSCG-928-K19]|nr:xylulokinase [Christensenellaceae bacterium OttesenSCG-928-K19]
MLYFMGIDAGTSGVKVIIIDEAGKICGMGYHECDVITPRPGWAEQSPLTWWEACDIAVQQAVANSGCGMEVAGIGFSGQMQGTAFLDKNLEPVDNCIIWLDQRAGKEVEEINALLPDNEAFDITANGCLNSFWAPKILWLKKNLPESYERVHKVVFAKDYIRYRMTGEIATEVSDASLSFLMNVPERKWADEVFQKLSIPKEIAPERLLESQDVAGYLKKDIAERWGMKEGIPVVAGGGDQPAGGVGTGIVRNGVIGATIGTSGVVFVCTDKPLIDKEGRAFMTMAHSLPDKWCSLGLILTAGGAFKWVRDTLFADKKAACEAAGMDVYDTMTELAAQSSPGSEGLTFLPYLNGEKTPISDHNARGTFFGLSLRHGMPELCRSVMEGVTFAMRDTIEICRDFDLQITEVRANGGGAKSALWRQMQADIYNEQVVTMNLEEGPAAGGAIMAAVGAGHFASIQEACDTLLKKTSTTEPIAENVKIYNDYYQTYKSLYPALKDNFKKQADIVEKYL